ncbi:MAG: hypothetical protein KGL95_01745, partial [Patescibacteria group bacterium]|nr:hypothetical protein [Patescibacteria group bacterium]
MKTHHVLLTLVALALAGAIGYEYLRKRKKSCKCSGKSGCTCGSKTSMPNVITSKAVNNAIPAIPVSSGNGATSIPSTGLPGMDSFISPNDNWSSWDGMGGEDAGMIDPVRHFVPLTGVQQFKPNQDVV